MKHLLLSVAAISALLAGCRSGPAEQAKEACGSVEARPAAPPRSRVKYAVLVNGDAARRHKRNIARAYTTLRAAGFDAAHIFVVSPPDRRTPLPKQTLRLAPVPDNFWRVMDDLAGMVEEGDLVVVYGTGHGDTEGGDSLLELRKGEVWPSDLREEIDKYRGDSVIIMDQCFSGGFADAFQGTKSRVIAISSVDSRHLTDCYYFAKTFWESFVHPERADSNHDGKASVREAFDAALKAHQEALAGDAEISANGAYRAFNGFTDVLLN